MLFRSPIDYFPDTPTLTNYIEAFTVFGVAQDALNTIIITAGALLISITFSLFAAYGFARFQSKALNIAFVALLFSTLIPGIITARSLFDLLRAMDLDDTFLGLILVYSSILAPFTLLVFRNSISQIPVEIEEAAEIDGANLIQILYYIYIPLMRPAIATMAIINFILSFNEFFAPLIYSYHIETLSLGITTLPIETEYSVPWEKISTMGWLMITPIILFVTIFEKRIMAGIMAGGVKQ
jgi:ABC-type glycerol-3-phosphate transport system permease component